MATKDPATLPEKATWYLATNLPRPGSPRAQPPGHPPAGLAEVVRIYGIRTWIEQGYKQVKDELGWADFQVRSDTAIRRHQTLVNCAFSFAWQTYPPPPDPQQDPDVPEPDTGPGERGPEHPAPRRTATWPRALRRVRAWLTPWITLQRWWQAWSNAPPPAQLRTLIDTVATGEGLHLYLPN